MPYCKNCKKNISENVMLSHYLFDNGLCSTCLSSLYPIFVSTKANGTLIYYLYEDNEFMQELCNNFKTRTNELLSMLLAPYLSYFTIRYCSNVFLNAQLEDLKISDHGKVLSYLILSLESFKNFFKPLQQRMDYVFIVLKQDSSKAIAKFLAQFNEKDRKKIIVIVAIKPRIDASSNNKLPAERRNV